jgi:hypothetical protein
MTTYPSDDDCMAFRGKWRRCDCCGVDGFDDEGWVSLREEGGDVPTQWTCGRDCAAVLADEHAGSRA